MRSPIRAVAALGLAALAIGVAACGGSDATEAAPAAPTTPAESAPPSEPAPAEPAPADPVSGTFPAGGGISVEEAIAIQGPVLVKGHLVVTGADARLCQSLLESHPPQCGGPSVAITGLDLALVGGLTAAEPVEGGETPDVRWTDAELSLFGTVANDVLDVDMEALAAS